MRQKENEEYLDVDYQNINFSGDQVANWIENLALEEIHMDESGVINFNEHLDPLPILEESSIEFMNVLRERFEFYMTRFNMCRGLSDPGATIKIFKISNTVNDFMLFRNSLKLIVSRKAPNLISVALISNSGGGAYSARMSLDATPISRGHELDAHIGPFNDISWRFQNEVVNVESLVKHYLSEFIKNSAK